MFCIILVYVYLQHGSDRVTAPTAGFSRTGKIKAMLDSLSTMSSRCGLHSKCHMSAGGVKEQQNQEPSTALKSVCLNSQAKPSRNTST